MTGEEAIALWLLEPLVPPGAAHWQDREPWCRVTVAARNAAFARLAADEWALQRLGVEGAVGNESPSPVGGFGDQKLYGIRRLPPEAGAPPEALDGVGKVVAAERFGAEMPSDSFEAVTARRLPPNPRA